MGNQKNKKKKMGMDLKQISKQVVTLKSSTNPVEKYTRGHFKEGEEYRNKKWQTVCKQLFFS